MFLLSILLVIVSLAFLYFLFLFMLSRLVDTEKEYERDDLFYRGVLDFSALLAIFFSRVRLHIEGKEKLPKGERVLFTGNHRSKYDPIVTWFAFREWKISFISKPENFSIPFFGPIIRKCCFLPIDREDPRKAFRTVVKAAGILKDGENSIGVYPEGTRNSGPGLLPFHNGVFGIATMSGSAIATVSVSGTDEIRKNWPLRHTDVYVRVVDVITKEETGTMIKKDIGERVRCALLSSFGEGSVEKEGKS